MTKTIFKKVVWVGRATTYLVGLAVILALSVGLASTALAGTGVGARFDLGKTNTANEISELVGSVAGPSLQIDNNSSGAAATALDLKVEAGKPPMTVDSQARVNNLNADRLDGFDSSELPGTVKDIARFAGVVPAIQGNSSNLVFVGPTTTVTVDGDNRLVGAASAPLGLTTSSTQTADVGLCYQSGAGAIINFVGANFSVHFFSSTRETYSATTFPGAPGAGTYNVKFCIRNYGANPINNNFVNGWVMVVDQ
jgi:hypothetical protein